MADLIVAGYDKRVVLPCGCALERVFRVTQGDAVEFTFCDAHRKVKFVKLDPNWPAMAAAAVASVARRLERFTTDDVWAEMDGDAVTGGDPRRMGVIMDQAARDGICAKSDDYAKSVRRECHGRSVRVWLSRVVKRKVKGVV